MDTLTWDYQRQVSRPVVVRPRVRPEDARQAPIVLAIFVITQLMDGSLTYWGVTRFGLDMEMNTLLAASMNHLGPMPALAVAKSLACLCGLILYLNSYLRPLAAMAGLCLGLAVVPWMFMAGWVAVHTWLL